MDKTPTCPYCGGKMEITKRDSMFWYVCDEDGAESPPEYNRDDALDMALHRASPWHSVKDGLPDSGTVCMVHGHNKRGVDCYDIACRDKTGWEFGSLREFGSLTSFEVVHWMAVPDAPKEVEHNEDRTPDEIKQGLQHCAGDGCEGCNYESVCYGADGRTKLPGDALRYIMQLEAADYDCVELGKARKRIEALEAERDATRAELDKYAGLCNICKHDKDPKPCGTAEGCSDCDSDVCPCKKCYDTDGKEGYEWDGGAAG